MPGKRPRHTCQTLLWIRRTRRWSGLERPSTRSSSKSSAEREGNNLKYFNDFSLKNGSIQGQNLVLTVLYVPCSLDNGKRTQPLVKRKISTGGRGAGAGASSHCLAPNFQRLRISRITTCVRHRKDTTAFYMPGKRVRHTSETL